jgi:hypothetical protein
MRRHELDPLSLLSGLTFSIAGLLFLAGRVDVAVRVRWLWPVLLLGLGLAILLGARPRRPAPEAGTEAAAPEAPPAEAGEPGTGAPEDRGEELPGG